MIIWEGEYKSELKSLAWESQNIVFSWAQYGDDLVYLVQNSQGLIFPGEEDFWIVPIEIMAAGKPVFALKKWGLTETVLAWETGDFFTDSTWSDFIKCFTLFHNNNKAWKYSAQNCQKQAKKYDSSIFEKKIRSYIV